MAAVDDLRVNVTLNPQSLAESMALAVLKGDLAAARALADLLLEDWKGGARELPPIRRLSADSGRLRVIVYFPLMVGDAEVDLDVDGVREAVRAWLDGGETLLLQGADRVELYELPEG